MEPAEEDVEQASLNFIPCMTWIRRGVAKANPEKVIIDIYIYMYGEIVG